MQSMLETREPGTPANLKTRDPENQRTPNQSLGVEFVTKAYPAQDLNAVAQQLTETLALQLPPIAITVTATPP